MDQIEKVKFFAVSGFLVLALAIVVVHNNGSLSNGSVRINADEPASCPSEVGFKAGSDSYNRCKALSADKKCKLDPYIAPSCRCSGDACDRNTSHSCQSMVDAALSGYDNSLANQRVYCAALNNPACRWSGNSCTGTTNIGPTRAYCSAITNQTTCGVAWGLCNWQLTSGNEFVCRNVPQCGEWNKYLGSNDPYEGDILRQRGCSACLSNASSGGPSCVVKKNGNDVSPNDCGDGSKLVGATCETAPTSSRSYGSLAPSIDITSDSSAPSWSTGAAGSATDNSDRAPMWSPGAAFTPVQNNTVGSPAYMMPTTGGSSPTNSTMTTQEAYAQGFGSARPGGCRTFNKYVCQTTAACIFMSAGTDANGNDLGGACISKCPRPNGCDVLDPANRNAVPTCMMVASAGGTTACAAAGFGY